MEKIILASASPRRQELLRQIGIDFQVVVKPVDETFSEDLTPTEAVCELARRKVAEVAKTLKDDAIVIGADTIVVDGNKILGKPIDAGDAMQTLRDLRGGNHLVITGFCITNTVNGDTIIDSETTRVFFRRFDDSEIQNYVKSGEPMDKAGSYGIQGLGAVLVERIEGCYFNVVGLPLTKVATALRSFGINVL